jgi:hypothetical protein
MPPAARRPPPAVEAARATPFLTLALNSPAPAATTRTQLHQPPTTHIVWKLSNDVDVLEVEEQVRGYAAEEADRARQQQQQQAQGGTGQAAFRGGYAPGAAAAGTAAASGSSLPVPLAAVTLGPDGCIAVPEARRRPTAEQAAAAARAGGWTDAIPRLRALQDALRGVFAFG